ncbi:MAG: hypothetical protein ACPG4T_19030, partial [Nannocystaceae bacterium]
MFDPPASKPAALLAPSTVVERVLSGDPAALDGATLTRYLAGEGELEDLMAAADRLRRAQFGNQV